MIWRRRAARLVCVVAAVVAVAGLGGAHGAKASGRAANAGPPQLPAATYPATVAQEVLIRMDDGVRLAATVTFPSLDGRSPAPGRFPVVLQMTPYGRDGECSCFPPGDFATRGIIGAVVDVRGTGGSEGSLKDNYFSPREQRDGYELVEYFGTQPYSTGKVGMAGGSYVGITQYLAAEQQPPHLAAITPAVALSDLYREGYTHEGIPNFFFDSQYLGVQQPLGLTGPNDDPGLFGEMLNAKIQQATGAPTLAFDYLARPDDGPFYRDRSPLYHADRIRVPVLIYDGWHDGFIFGANEMYKVLSRRPGVATELYVDPCTHKGCGPPFDPLENPSNLENTEAVIFEFLHKHLVAGAQDPARTNVRVYVQGAGRFLQADRWPPADAGLETLYLTPEGLSTAAPGSQATQSYITDPAAGLGMSFDQYGTVAASPYIPLDQRTAEEAGLTWRTPALASPLTLSGESALHLVAASTANDTDWFAKLSDVGPDGSETIITEGFLRASHRALDAGRSTPTRPWHTNTDPTPIEAGRYIGYDLAIWPTAYELAAGHRLQLRLTSYDFPTHLPGTLRLDPANPSSASFVPLSPATNTVRTGGSDPSYLRVVALGASPQHGGRARPGCRRPRRLVIRLPHRPGRRFVRAVAYVGRRRVASRAGHDLRRIVLHGLPPRRVTVRLRLTTSAHRHLVLRRRWRGCR